MANISKYIIGKEYWRKRGDSHELTIRYKDNFGVIRRKSFSAKTKVKCLEKAKAFAEELEFRARGVDVDINVTIPELVKMKLDLDLAKNYVGIQGYHRNVETLAIIERSFLGSIPIRNVNVDLIEMFLSKITVYADNTIRKIYSMLRSAFVIAVDKGVLEFDIMRRNNVRKPKSSKEPKKVRGLTEAEQKRLVAAVHDHKVPFGKNDYSLQIMIELYSGMRMGEINALKPEHIDFDRMVIKVRGTISSGEKSIPFISEKTKTAAGVRDIPISKVLEPYLREAVKRYKNNVHGLLFYDHRNNKIITTSQVNCFYRRICEKAGVEFFGQHALRHTFATRCIESGVQPVVLKNWLGHTDIHMTLDTYADVFNRLNNNAIDKFDELVSNLCTVETAEEKPKETKTTE